MCRDYNKMFERFHADYEEKYGKEPYEGAVVKFRWWDSLRFSSRPALNVF